jgi:3'(2'), 5'-bisphosphate nucleotidase
MTYEPELHAALEAVEAAAPAILAAYADFQPIPDAAASISLPVDRETQEVLLQRLSSTFPGDAFCAEEATPTLERLAGPGSGRTRAWIIDPIDGTRGFAMKNGEFSVMVGLVDQGQVAVGVVLEPVRRRLTYATRDGGCWRRDRDGPLQRCHVSRTESLAGGMLTVSRSSTGPKRWPQVDALGDVRLLPAYSAGLKLALVARGEADLYLNVYANFNDWDICAGQVLVEEAGGKVCTLTGREVQYGHGRDQQRDGLLASNGRVHDEALAALRRVTAS